MKIVRTKQETLPGVPQDEFDRIGDVAPSGLTICWIAKEIGKDKSTIRKRARKLGIRLEILPRADAQGHVQDMLTTDADGRRALFAIYRSSCR